MAGWKELGYVPDSDDEDLEVGAAGDDSEDGHQERPRSKTDGSHIRRDLRSQGSSQRAELNANAEQSTQLPTTATPSKLSTEDSKWEPQHKDLLTEAPSATVQASSTSVAERLEAELARGLASCNDVLNSGSSPLFWEDDSPLSSLPSSPAASPVDLACNTNPDQLDRPLIPPSISVAPQQPSPTALHPGFAGRSLRPRALMQVHPYTIEYAKYQQDWKARGMQPVRTLPGQASPRARGHEETQETDAFQSSQNAGSSPQPPSSSPMNGMMFDSDDSQGLPRPSRPIAGSPVPNPDDEFPDLADIFSGKARFPQSIPVVTKRPRIQEGSSTSRHKRLRLTDPVLDAAAAHVPETVHENVFDLPLSPPRSASLSSSLTPVDAENVVRLSDLTPGPLPTPVLSSDRQVDKRTTIDVSTSSENSSESEEEAVASPRLNEEEFRGLAGMKKRIKGVLPASWLKLDARQQHQPPAAPRNPLSPRRPSPIKGVARSHSSGRPSERRERQVWPLDVDSEGSGSDTSLDDEEDEETKSAESSRPLYLSADEELLMDDVIVEEEIDAMLPSVPRVIRARRRPNKKRQQRLEDAWTVAHQVMQTCSHRKEANSSGPMTQISRRKSRPKRRKVRPTMQPLTVMDAPGLSVTQHVPRFLKVAARSRGSGRAHVQDPKQKFFRLETADDTVQINRELRDWTSRSDVARRNSKAHATSLARLQGTGRAHHADPRTQQQYIVETAPDIKAQVRELKNSNNKILSRLRQQTVGTTSGASNKPSSVLPGESHRSRNLGVFFTRINRSGQGQFLNPVNTRIAQLEAPCLSLLPVRKTVKPPDATQQRFNSSTISANPLQPSPAPIVHQPSRYKRKKISPKMSEGTDTSGYGSGSISNEESIWGEAEDLKGHFVGWMDQIYHRDIGSDLEQLISPAYGDYETSPYIAHGGFAAMLNDLNIRRQYHIQRRSHDPSIPPTMPFLNDFMSILRELQSFLPLVTGSHPCPHRGTAPDEVGNISRLLIRAQEYLSRGEWFSDLPGSARISDEVFVELIRIFNSITGMFANSSSAHMYVAVFIMSHLAIIGYQLVEISSEAGDANQLSRSFEFTRTTMRDALKMTTLTRAILRDRDATDPFEGVGRSGMALTETDMGEFICRYYMSAYAPDQAYFVDTIIIIYHLVHRRVIPGLNLDFKDLIYEVCHNTFPLSGVDSMLLSLRVMRMVHPLTRLDACGRLLHENDGGFNGWEVLTLAVNGFMVLMATLGPTSSVSKEVCIRAHLFLIRHCFSFLRDWNWIEPDGILKTMFHVYGERNMRDMLVTGRIRFRRTPLEFSPDLSGGETDFRSFLKLVTLALEQKRPFLESSNEVVKQSAYNKVQSLVWSLLPNSGADFNQQLRSNKIDYQSLQNRYDLILTLYVHAPAKCRPSPRQVSSFVTFEACPSDLRELLINVWTDMTQYAMALQGRRIDVDELVEWGSLMLNCLLNEFESTKETLTVTNDEARHDTLKHRANISGSLADLLRGWTTVLISCPSGLYNSIFPYDFMASVKAVVTVATTQLDDTKYMAPDHTARLCDFRLRHRPLVAAMHLLTEILIRPDVGVRHFREAADSTTRDIVSTILSSDCSCSLHQGQIDRDLFSVIADIVQSWFKVASGSVSMNTTWDKYLAPQSSHSFALLANSELSRQAHVLFMSMIIQQNPLVFRMDRATFYKTWIESLVIPEHLMAFEHCLTAEIHHYDVNTTFLGAAIQPTLMQHSWNSLSLVGDQTPCLKLERLIQHRLDLVRALIGQIRYLQSDPPSDDSQTFAEESIDANDLLRLLKVMTDTMKRYWRALPTEKQPAYAEFIWKVISELQKYAFEDYVIDEWFTRQGNGEFPTPSSRFADHFNRPVGALRRKVDAHMSRSFRMSLIAAVESDVTDAWLSEMSEALSCNSTQLLANDRQLAVDSQLQIQFLRLVCTTYIEQAFETPEVAGLANIVIRLLVNVIDNASLRLDEANDGQAFAEMVVDLLGRIVSLVQKDDWAVRLCVPCADLALVCYKRFRCLQASNQSSEVICGLSALADRAARTFYATGSGELVEGVGGFDGVDKGEESEAREEERRNLRGLLRGGKEWRELEIRQVDGERVIREWEEAMSDEWGVEDVAFLFL